MFTYQYINAVCKHQSRGAEAMKGVSRRTTTGRCPSLEVSSPNTLACAPLLLTGAHCLGLGVHHPQVLDAPAAAFVSATRRSTAAARSSLRATILLQRDTHRLIDSHTSQGHVSQPHDHPHALMALFALMRLPLPMSRHSPDLSRSWAARGAARSRTSSSAPPPDAVA